MSGWRKRQILERQKMDDHLPDYDPDDDRRSGFCSECGEHCTATIIDEGIGSYEYWGAKGVDVRLVEVSPC